jgi:hypothetical protein
VLDIRKKLPLDVCMREIYARKIDAHIRYGATPTFKVESTMLIICVR